MSRLITNAIRSTSATADAITMDGSGNVTFPANATCSGTATGFGKILQVIQTVKTDTASTTNEDNFEDISGMSVTITPSATSSKILVMVDMRLSTNENKNVAYRLMRGSTQIYMGDASGNITRATGSIRLEGAAKAEMQTEGAIFLDSPSTTSATTYKVQWTNTYHTNASYINRPYESTDSNDRVRAASSITVQEVAA